MHYNPYRTRLELAVPKDLVKVMDADDELPGAARPMIVDVVESILEVEENE